jgi:hypothetical protein
MTNEHPMKENTGGTGGSGGSGRSENNSSHDNPRVPNKPGSPVRSGEGSGMPMPGKPNPTK